MVAAIAEAMIGPKPGMLIGRRAVSPRCASLAMVCSNRTISSSRFRNCITSGANTSQTSNGIVLSQAPDQPGEFAGVSGSLRRDNAYLG